MDNQQILDSQDEILIFGRWKFWTLSIVMILWAIVSTSVRRVDDLEIVLVIGGAIAIFLLLNFRKIAGLPILIISERGIRTFFVSKRGFLAKKKITSIDFSRSDKEIIVNYLRTDSPFVWDKLPFLYYWSLLFEKEGKLSDTAQFSINDESMAISTEQLFKEIKLFWNL